MNFGQFPGLLSSSKILLLYHTPKLVKDEITSYYFTAIRAFRMLANFYSVYHMTYIIPSNPEVGSLLSLPSSGDRNWNTENLSNMHKVTSGLYSLPPFPLPWLLYKIWFLHGPLVMMMHYPCVCSTVFSTSGDVCSGLVSVVACFLGLVPARYMWDVFPFVAVNPHWGDWNCFALWQRGNIRLGESKQPVKVQGQVQRL